MNNEELNIKDPPEILRAITIKELLQSRDFIYAFLCTLVIVLIMYSPIGQAQSENSLTAISEMIFANAININSTLLGIIIAAVAIFTAFSRPELLARLYFYKKDENRLHQYLLVLVYPAKPAIAGIFLAFVGNILLLSKHPYISSIISVLVFFFTFYCIFGIWECIKQIANSIVTLARKNNS